MNATFKTLLSSALLATSFSAFALTDAPTADQAPAATPTAHTGTAPGLHLTLNAGLTYGGDTLATLNFTDGTSSKIKAGSFMQFGIGMLHQSPDTPLALMLSMNYHMDSVNAKNGSASFDRFPIEALAYYTGKDKMRLGGGVRFVTSPKLSVNFNGSSSVAFNSTTGLVVEGGYQVDPHGWVNLRFVSETYKATGYVPANGSHMGINFTYEY